MGSKLSDPQTAPICLLFYVLIFPEFTLVFPPPFAHITLSPKNTLSVVLSLLAACPILQGLCPHAKPPPPSSLPSPPVEQIPPLLASTALWPGPLII